MDALHTDLERQKKDKQDDLPEAGRQLLRGLNPPPDAEPLGDMAPPRRGSLVDARATTL